MTEAEEFRLYSLRAQSGDEIKWLLRSEEMFLFCFPTNVRDMNDEREEVKQNLKLVLGVFSPTAEPLM